MYTTKEKKFLLYFERFTSCVSCCNTHQKNPWSTLNTCEDLPLQEFLAFIIRLPDSWYLYTLILDFNTSAGTSLPGGPVVKNPSCNADDSGSIPGQGAKTPHASLKPSLGVAATEPTPWKSVCLNERYHMKQQRSHKIQCSQIKNIRKKYHCCITTYHSLIYWINVFFPKAFWRKNYLGPIRN